MHHGQAFAAGAGYRCASGVGLERSSIGEAGSVITDLGEHPGAGERSQSWQASDDLSVRVFLEIGDRCGGEPFGINDGGFQVGVAARGLGHRKRPRPRARCRYSACSTALEPSGLNGGCPLAPGLNQQMAELVGREVRSRARG